jgi:hypothetical protein
MTHRPVSQLYQHQETFIEPKIKKDR